ncbi:MAG TPA: secondary thiamine-phosphate synthase enzyme YjbQ [Acidobacteriota bacterium]|nr:secondary thiamine-phosphate synthase enzyme YjbQ [Acidobacteriota bacterium]
MITTTKSGLAIRSHTLKVLTDKKVELYNITQKVRDFVRSTSIQEGFLLVTSLHTTTALFINEVQSALLDDIKAILQDWVKDDQPWKHNSPEFSDCERHNATSHLRAILLGHSQTVMVQDGEPALGEWQSIVFAELDGPREREIRVQVIGI